MKKLFIFLALTQQGFCSDSPFCNFPSDKAIAPYSSTILHVPPTENALLNSMCQRSYLANTRSFDTIPDLSDQEINEWMNYKQPISATAAPSATPSATPMNRPAMLTPVSLLAAAMPPVTSKPLAPVKKNTVYNFTHTPITQYEFLKLMEVRKFVCDRYIDSVGDLTCDASNAYLGVHQYISKQPWPDTTKYRILCLLAGYGTRLEIQAYRQIFAVQK